MTLDEYQKWTRTTALYRSFTYPQLALAEEVGEFLGKIAKYTRDVIDNDDLSVEQRAMKYDQLTYNLQREAGDIMWQLARCLDDFGISMQAALDTNVEKIEKRKEFQTIRGSGDDR